MNHSVNLPRAAGTVTAVEAVTPTLTLISSQTIAPERSGPHRIPFNPALTGRLVITPKISPAAVEQYRRLAATLHHSQIEQELRAIMVTSAVPGEGKTLTAANLALTLSESYRRHVLLIDADLRRPALCDVFHMPNAMGLSDWLKSSTDKKLTAVSLSEHLAYIPAGRPDPDPMSGLTSDRMGRLLKDARAMFDWIIIDTPPVGILSDANLLVTGVDLALLVIRAGTTPYELIQGAVQSLGRERLLGVVMNCTRDDALARNRYGYGSYYSYERTGRAK